MINKYTFNFQKHEMGIGRRKQSTARVFFQPGKGNLTINNIVGEKYLQYNNIYLNKIFEPLEIFEKNTIYDIIVLVRGGGITGQVDSIILGVARLFSRIQPESRKLLKKNGFLTQDSRVKERKKYGLRKARKAPQFSKR
jgi:small subunit ribosomal protein S9